MAATAASDPAETLAIPVAGLSLDLPSETPAEMPGELEHTGVDTQPFSQPGIASPVPAELPNSLDFELELDAPVKPAAEEAGGFSGMETLVMPEREAEPAEESDYLDVELQKTDLGVAVEPVGLAVEPSSGEDVAMIELERSDAMASKPMDFSFDFAQQAAETAPKSVDLSSIDLNLDPPAPVEPVAAAVPPAAPAAAPAVAAKPAAAEPVAAEVTSAPVSAEEVATKLELAHAYEEMGDKEGARELLQEVMQEGNPEQQASVRAKLAKLS